MTEVWYTLKHLSIHLGPAVLTAIIVAWWSWRIGQLSNPKHSAALALSVPPTPQQPLARKPRLPLTLIILAIVMGFGVGVPIATVVIAMNAGGPAPTAPARHH